MPAALRADSGQPADRASGHWPQADRPVAGGMSQPARLHLTEPQLGLYRGSATVSQSAFGIKPYSGFFGALKLRDEVAVEVEADLNRAAG